jgi:hypothetical protein
MAWNISTVQTNYCDSWIIEGFKNSCTVYTTIKRTTYQDAKDNKQKYLGSYPDYNEGIALSYINDNLVYIIDVTIDNNREEVEIMKKNEYVSTKQLIYNGVPYMGLPFSVFAHWKGLIDTDID